VNYLEICSMSGSVAHHVRYPHSGGTKVTTATFFPPGVCSVADIFDFWFLRSPTLQGLVAQF
jgi:hypothetical protein